jgi:hypothetical protein
MTNAQTTSKAEPEPTTPKEKAPSLFEIEHAWRAALLDTDELVTILKANCERVSQMSKKRGSTAGWRNRNEARHERMAAFFALQDLASAERHLRWLCERAEEAG